MSNLQTIFLCDPGGNQTYIVANENKEIGSANIGGVHHRILQKFPKLEQGGYLVPPKFSTSAARLEMAGGEFCGNALRCLAAVVASTLEGKTFIAEELIQTNAVSIHQDHFRTKIEISGCEGQLSSRICTRDGRYEVEVAMPSVCFEEVLLDQTIYLNANPYQCNIAHLSGISHLVFRDADIATLSDYDRKALLTNAETLFHLKDVPAIGLIDIQSSTLGESITPFVWVRSIDTFFFETACGSGSVACALVKAAAAENSQSLEVQLLQPSGAYLSVEVFRKRHPLGIEYFDTNLSGSVPVVDSHQVNLSEK